ncbi:biopolymer transporter ExbD [uncultured Campylobacter sp.]|uniref:ExbD/TolR family protein n=1 Tax=uncultured Campylobacter sp. TaxID=218934 RepID=UPI00262D687B|nr:biopolymer transporter ExbD [uncultured Campylobacter sp.]
MKYVRRDKTRYAGISMLNLIDVIFVLLLFFMVTTSFNKFAHIDIALPQSASNLDEKETKNVEVFYLLNGEVLLSINGEQKSLNLADLAAQIENLTPKQKESVKLNADEAINYGEVVNLISILKDNGTQNVELNIKKKPKG